MTRLLDWLIHRSWTTVSVILAVISLFALWFTLTSFIEFSGLAFGLAKIGIGIATIGLIDNVIFGNLETIKELREKNIAFAIAYGALILFVGLILATV